MKDTPRIDLENKWKSTYTSITEQVGDPSWINWYLELTDENPFYLPDTEGEHLFCEDSNIEQINRNMNIRSCQRDWLMDSSNRYNLTNFYNVYDNMTYPTSNIPSSPFNHTCEEIENDPVCQRGWLTSDINPFRVCTLILIIFI